MQRALVKNYRWRCYFINLFNSKWTCIPRNLTILSLSRRGSTPIRFDHFLIFYPFCCRFAGGAGFAFCSGALLWWKKDLWPFSWSQYILTSEVTLQVTRSPWFQCDIFNPMVGTAVHPRSLCLRYIITTPSVSTFSHLLWIQVRKVRYSRNTKPKTV